jgi:hypothetical protein
MRSQWKLLRLCHIWNSSQTALSAFRLRATDSAVVWTCASPKTVSPSCTCVCVAGRSQRCASLWPTLCSRCEITRPDNCFSAEISVSVYICLSRTCLLLCCALHENLVQRDGRTDGRRLQHRCVTCHTQRGARESCRCLLAAFDGAPTETGVHLPSEGTSPTFVHKMQFVCVPLPCKSSSSDTSRVAYWWNDFCYVSLKHAASLK